MDRTTIRVGRRVGRGLRRDGGLSLVELMVGLAVGLTVVAAGGFMLGHQMHDHRRLVIETQLQQDLRTALDIVVRDLRRAGHWGRAEHGLWTAGAMMRTNAYGATGGVAPGATATAVSFAYSTDVTENDSIDGAEHAGFRLHLPTRALQIQLGTGNWQQLTDPATLVVDRFDVTLRERALNLARHCAAACPPATPACGPTQRLREYDVVVEGHAAVDATVRRSLRATVRPRNDIVVGTCPA